MPISPRSFETIVANLRNRMTTSIPSLDTSEGSFFRIAMIDPLALELVDLEELLLTVQESQYLMTATGSDLDLLAENYNVLRRGAQKASGFVQIYAPQLGFTDPITIAKGTIITSKDGIQYKTLVEGILNGFDGQQSTRNGIAIYQVNVPVVCLVDGAIGTAASGTLINIALAGLSVTNDSTIIGGYDEETDTSLTARALISFGIWSRGVKAAVEYGARTVPGVFYASAVYAYAGHFNLYVSDEAGNLSDEMRAAVNAELINWASAGIGWTLIQPPLFLLNLTIKVTFRSATNPTERENQFRTDVATIINSSKESIIYIDDLYAQLKALTSLYVLHFDIDTPSDNVVKDEGTIVRSGTITLVNQTT